MRLVKIASVLIPLVILISMAGYYFAVTSVLPSADENPAALSAGSFGDMFGAFNAFFTAVAFGAVIVSLIFHARELTLLKKAQDSTENQLKITQDALTSELENRKLSYRLELVPQFIRIELEHLDVHHPLESKGKKLATCGISTLRRYVKECDTWVEQFNNLENKIDFPMYNKYAAGSAKFKPKKFVEHLECYRRNLVKLINLREELDSLEIRTRETS